MKVNAIEHCWTEFAGEKLVTDHGLVLPGFHYVYIRSNNNKSKNIIWFYWADVHNKDTFDGRKQTLSFLQNLVESLKIKMHS